MPVPAPDTLELARAGALIVGVRRRDAALEREMERRADLTQLVSRREGLVVLIIAGLIVLFAVFLGGASGAVLSLFALVFSWMNLAAGLTPKALIRELGFRPDELAQLVGYVEAPEDGDPRVTGLGERAVRTYLAWREPAPTL